jgi:4-hydroxy-tetrahydrodipicolinate synthase
MTLEVNWMRGCATALVTPFGVGGQIDEQRLREFVEFQIDGGVRILIPCGTTGESAAMTEEEDRRVIRTVVEQSHGRAKVIAGTGSNSTVATIEYSRAAKDLGVDGVLVVAPYYNKPTQDGLRAHFSKVADSIDGLPVMVYNVPGRTSVNITAETILYLASNHENIVAVKEASGNIAQIMAIIAGKPAGFRVFSGDDSLTLPIIACGGDGIVSVASNEAPRLMCDLTDAALAGRYDDARELHYRLLPLMEGNFIESSPGPVKAALAIMGLIEENLRLPLVPVQETTRQRIGQIIEQLGLTGR